MNGESMTTYLSRLVDLLESAAADQDETLDAVAGRMADTLAAGGLVHLFGSGHSVIPCLDAFPRYGSYAGLNPLTDPRLMWHNVLGPGGVRELLWLERTEGYVEQFLAHEPLAAGDGMLVFSHSGLNAAPIEAARYGQRHGLWVAGVTSRANETRPTGHSSGKRLGDVSDYVLDTGVPVEDALVPIEGASRPVGGASTLVAAALTHELLARTAVVLAEKGIHLPTFVSPTVPGATLSSNDEVFARHAALLAERRAALDVPGR
jgi:uncharacterized phosphosugar-binding protein